MSSVRRKEIAINNPEFVRDSYENGFVFHEIDKKTLLGLTL